MKTLVIHPQDPTTDFLSYIYAGKGWKELENYRKKMEKAGIFDIPAPSFERVETTRNFEAETPRPKSDNWIYADFSKVKEWAENEPTEFIEIIKSEI